MNVLTATVLFLSLAVSPVALQYPSGSGSGHQDSFVCDDGMMITAEWVCDDFEDCYDGSDESDCVTSCDSSEFHCRDRRGCVPQWRVCNLDRDCADGSDESPVLCVVEPEGPRNCTDAEFRCGNLKCIPLAYTCDGEDDCGDESDEMDCSSTPSTSTCNDNQFRCDNGLCIPDFYMCDGEVDCYGEELPSDEIDCDGVEAECGQGFFNCTNGKCINLHSYCDGANDCGDESDEQDCPGIQCSYTQFLCTINDILSCISDTWLCDGIPDCSDSSDESGCSAGCPPAHFQCTSSDVCVPLDQKCDGTPNCPDSSDEYVCPFPPPSLPCRGNQFSCLDGQQCLELAQVCDGVSHCVDGSDEEDICSTVADCQVNNGGCEGVCHQLTSTRFCSCPPGYQLDLSDLSSCIDIDECSHPDSCPQLCNNTDGGFECSCVEGYQMTEAGECKAEGGPAPYILFANRVDIRTVSLNGSEREVLVNHLQYAVGLDYHYELGYMFWSDLTSDDIKRANLDGTNITTIVSVGLSAPDGLAVDWVSDKLYWADAENSRIEVSDLDGNRRKLLFSTDLDKPRAVVVDPRFRYLFWTDWGSPPKIERSSLDGTDRRVLHIDHLSWPNALTLDHTTSTLYWADAKLHIIESSDIHGQNRRPVLTTGVLHPFGVTVFENRLYWSDWNTLAIVSIMKDVGRNLTQVESELTAQQSLLMQNATEIQTNLFFPTDLHVVHPVLQPPAPNPCGSDNGGCEYLCLLSSEREEGYSCACPTGIELKENGKDCKSFNTFLIFARRMELRLISLDVPEINDVAIPLSNLSGAVAVDTYADTESVFWTDKFEDTISTAQLDGSNQTILIDTDLSSPEGLSVDWVSRKLYWTNDGDDSSLNAIEVAELDGSNRLVLIHEDLDKPSDIVVHPTAGYMFWSDWGALPRIERANLDGSGRVAIVTKHLGRPHGLALDYDLDLLYWCDAVLDVIEYVDLDGNGRAIVLKGLSHPFGLALYGDQLYWTDWQEESLQSVNRTSGEMRTTLVSELGFALDVSVFERNRTKPDSHPCYTDNGGCSHLCLTRPNSTLSGQLQVTCACPTGLKLMDDKRNCFTIVQDYVAFPTDSLFHQISLDTPLLVDVSTHFNQFRDGSAISVDIATDYIYWTDKLESKIYRAPLEGNGPPEVFISTNLVTPEDVVVDWIGRTLYWADSGTGRIEVADLEGGARRVIVQGLVQVLGLALDIRTRTLYWIEGGGNDVDRVPRIEMSAMDGSNRTVLVLEALGRPRAIAVDNPIGQEEGEGRVYWTDNLYQRIESVSLNGSHRRVEIDFAVSSTVAPLGVAVMDDYIYWTDGDTNSVNRFRKTDNLEREELMAGLTSVGHVIIVRNEDVENRALYSHPCDVAHGCSRLCLPDHSLQGYTCACPTGLHLAQSGKTCRNIPLKFAVMSLPYQLEMVLLEGGTDENIVVTIKGEFEKPIAIDHFLLSNDDGLIFFTDSDRHVISSINMNGTGLTDIVDIGVSSGLAVDWVGRMLYWTDTEHNTVEVCRMDGTGRKVLINSGLDEPRGITLNPKEGLMYWTDWGVNPAIFRAKMDGSFVSRIVQTDITWPNGISLDLNTSPNRLYWVDAWHDRLESSSINGLVREVFLENDNQNLHHSFEVVVHDGFVYWTDWYQQALIRKEIGLGGEETLAVAVNRPFGFTVVDTATPRRGELTGRAAASACGERNGGCTSIHLCLPVDADYRKCACPDSLLPFCREYYGLKFQPPPPPPSLNNGPDPTLPPPTVTSGTTQSTTTRRVTTGTTGTLKSITAEVSRQQDPSGQDMNIIMGIIVVVVIVIIIITIIFLFTFLWIRRDVKRERLRRRHKESLKRLQFSNPNYIGMNVREQRRDTSTSTTSSRGPGEITSLLPKRNNHSQPGTLQTSRSTRQTNSNLFVEEPDVFIIPGQPQTTNTRLPTPDSPPLKKPAPPESPPLKPPAPLPFSEPAPLVTTPPPVPPKTPTGGKPRMPEPVEVIVQTEPKQSNVERERAVRFHPDAKTPTEDDPPPLPVRGLSPTTLPTTTVYKDPIAVTMDTVTMDTSSNDSANDTTSETLSDTVVIVDSNGSLVGEMITSPVVEAPPTATPTSVGQRAPAVSPSQDN